MRWLLTAVLLVLLAGSADARWSGGGGVVVVSSPSALITSFRDSSANWKMAGLQSIGGIPNRTTQCGSTLTPNGTEDTSQINTAITNCTVGQYVSLGSGTFKQAEGNVILLNKGVTLRGQGAGVTILQRTPGADATGNVCNAAGNWGATFGSFCPGNNPGPVVRIGGGAAWGSQLSLAADTTAGTTTVSVNSNTGISVGVLVNLDELGNSSAQPSPDWNTSGGVANQVWAQTDYSTEWNAHNPTVGGFDSACFDNANFTAGGNCTAGGNHQDAIAYSIRGGGVMEEYHLVTGITGSGPYSVTFDSPVTRVYHTANSAALTVFTTANEIQKAGLENLTVEYGDNDNIDFQGCIYCWASGVESTLYLNPSIHLLQGVFRAQLTNFWAHEGVWPVNGGGGYNIALTYGTSEDLIDNGISMKANKCIVMRASGVGSVVAYNYMDDQYIGNNSSWVETCLNDSHLVGPGHNVFEGNWAPNIDSDYTHGAVSYGTYFRNNVTGIRAPWTSNFDSITRDDTTGCCSPMRAASSHPYTYWTSFVGNILGTPGITTTGNGWDYQDNAFTNKHLLMLGWNDLNVGGANTSGPDDTANVIYPADPRTSGTTGRFASSTGCMTNTSNPCTTIVDGNYDYVQAQTSWDSRGTKTLPSSFYLTSAPAYFTTGYTWPPIDPITPKANEIPAHERWQTCSVFSTAAATASCLFNTSTPQVAFIASPSTIISGGSSTLKWASFNDTSCTGTNFSTGSGSPIYGAVSTGTLTSGGSPYTYTVTCGGTAVNATVTVNSSTNTAWDPTHKSTNLTLSTTNSTNDTASNTGTSTDSSVYSTVSKSETSAKMFAELKCGISSGGVGFGIATSAGRSDTYLGETNNSAAFYNTTGSGAQLYFNNVASGVWPSCVNGDTIGLFIDTSVNPIQVYANVYHAGVWGSKWNNTTESTPVSGGYALSSGMSGGAALYLGTNLNTNGNSGTLCTNVTCAPGGNSDLPAVSGAVWWDSAP